MKARSFLIVISLFLTIPAFAQDVPEEEFKGTFNNLFEESKKDFEGVEGKTDKTGGLLFPGAKEGEVKEDDTGVQFYIGKYFEKDADKAYQLFNSIRGWVSGLVPDNYEEIENPQPTEDEKRFTYERKADNFSVVAKEPSAIILLQQDPDAEGFFIEVRVKEPVFRP